MCKILVRGKKRKKGIKEGTGRETKEGKKKKVQTKHCEKKNFQKCDLIHFVLTAGHETCA